MVVIIWQLDLQLPIQSVTIITNVVNPTISIPQNKHKSVILETTDTLFIYEN
jgi:hypothetical protein